MPDRLRSTPIAPQAILAITAQTLVPGQVIPLCEVMERYINERKAREDAAARAEAEGHVQIQFRKNITEDGDVHHACVHALLVLLQAKKYVPAHTLAAFHHYGSIELNVFERLIGSDQLPRLEEKLRALQENLATIKDIEAAFTHFSTSVPTQSALPPEQWQEIRALVTAVLDADDSGSHLSAVEQKKHNSLVVTTRFLLRSIGQHPQWFPYYLQYMDMQETQAEIMRIKNRQLPMSGSDINSARPGLEKRVALYRQIFEIKGWEISASATTE